MADYSKTAKPETYLCREQTNKPEYGQDIRSIQLEKPHQPQVVKRLREQGHQVFDFRNPPDGKGGFFWKDVDPNWENWTTQDYISHLDHEWARYGFQRDFDAMR